MKNNVFVRCMKFHPILRMAAMGFMCLFAGIVQVKAQGGAAGQLPQRERAGDVLRDRSIDWKNPQARVRAVERMKQIEERELQEARKFARQMGKPVREKLPNGKVREVVGIGEDGELLYYETRNANAAISTAANKLQQSPYLVVGSGVIVGVWDADSVLMTHQEFTNGVISRVTNKNAQPTDDHSTHVGGTIAASGINANAKGMVPAAKIDSYDWDSDISEMTAAGATAPDQFATKLYLSNHSYGYGYGWNYDTSWTWTGTGTNQDAYDADFGKYSYKSDDFDIIVYNAPYYTIFWAAGNERNDGPVNGNTVTIGGSSVTYDSSIHPPNDGDYRNGFETIGDHGLAKNIITIGAANDAVTSGLRVPAKATITAFSSTGPCDDGRIKPDLVANGYSLTSATDTGDANYVAMSGTSMASPNACGSAGLLVAMYKDLFAGGAMLASTLKGLLIHTASDIGNQGPDYTYGWGLIDVKTAGDLIIDHHANPGKQRLIESFLSTAIPSRTYTITSDGSPIRATLCWTDPAGAPISGHDVRTPNLVNDLNVKVIAPDGTTAYLPFVMPFVGTWTVASMSQIATTGTNRTDNVEQVLIPIPGQAGNWQIVVSHAGTLTNNEQDFSLILSGMTLDPNSINLVSPNGGEQWTIGSTQDIIWGSGMGGNVKIELFRGASLDSTISASTTNNGSFSWDIPVSQVVANSYTVKITSIESPTKFDSSDANFNIIPTLAEALDATGITWTNSGSAVWFPQIVTTHDAVDAAQSGAIGDSQSSSLQSTLVGPGTLTFWWKVSSESGYDFLTLYLNDVAQTGSLAKIAGTVDWVQKTVSIPSGTNTVKWTYSKDVDTVAGSDAAWLDQVVYTPVGPEIAVEQPIGSNLVDGSATINFASVDVGRSTNYTFTVKNVGSANLTGLALIKSGTHTNDFTLGSLGAATLAAGASTTFTVTFAPVTTGARTAILQITSNDTDENPFDIGLTGTGVFVKAPATVTLGNLSQVYNGLARSVTTTTSPTGLAVNVTYNGNDGAPTNAGNYAVAATINDLAYQGSTNGTLVVSAALPTVTNWPTASSIAIGQALSNVTFTGGSGSVAGSFFFVSATNIPPVGVYTAAVTFVATDNVNYQSVTGTVVITVVDVYKVPFFESFEARQRAELNGQYGWISEGTVVQTNKASGGSTNAAQIVGEGGYLKHTFNDGRTKVWTDMRVQVVQSAEKPTPDTNSTVAVYVSTNAMVMAFNGTNAVPAGIQAASNAWVRFTFFSDYVAKTYILYVNDVRAGKYIFYNTNAMNFAELKVGGQATFVDDVGVTLSQPAMNGMPSLILLQ